MAEQKLHLRSVLLGLCPNCHQGHVLKSVWTLFPKCPVCGYDFYPEPGFYLGAMMVAYLLNSALIVPPMIVLKLVDVDIKWIIAYPFVQFIFVMPFMLMYCRIVWLHLEYRTTRALDGKKTNHRRGDGIENDQKNDNSRLIHRS